MSARDIAIANARAVPIEDEVARRGIDLKRDGRELTGPCPLCGGSDRFSVNTRKQCWNCRRCKPEDIAGDVIGFVMWHDDCGFVQAVETLTGNDRPPPARRREAHKQRRHDSGYWRSIWAETVGPAGTPVETYLARRPGGLALPPDCIDVRFHPRCPFGKDGAGRTIYTPAMVALVRNIISNKPQAIHRTAIDLRGNKRAELGDNGRMSLGPTKGGAVKLTPDEHVTIGLGIGEGLESTLSLRRLPEWKDSPVWSVLFDGGIKEFPVLPGIEALVVAVDHDLNGAGQRSTLAAVERWSAVGREVIAIKSDQPGEDLNDVVGVM
jgi:hypothetical protein